MESLALGIKMTIRLEGLNSEQVARLHRAVEDAKTKTRVAVGRTEGEGVKFIEVSKSHLDGGCGYTVLLTVHPALQGYLDPTKKVVVFPSREGLDGIFNAVNILPSQDIVEEIRPGGIVPGKFGYGQPDVLKVEGVGLR